jgi:hypothetical protein
MFDRFKCLLIVPAMLTLAGCPAGPLPLVGWETDVPEVGSRTICCGGTPVIVEKTYEHRYDLKFSPEGRRSNVRLKTHFEYVLLQSAQPPRKLPFLTTYTHHNDDGRFSALYAIDPGRMWAGYAPVPDDEGTGDSWRYVVKVFTADGIVHETELDVLKKNRRIEFAADVPGFRFHHRNGDALYDIRTGRLTMTAPPAPVTR